MKLGDLIHEHLLALEPASVIEPRGDRRMRLREGMIVTRLRHGQPTPGFRPLGGAVLFEWIGVRHAKMRTTNLVGIWHTKPRSATLVIGHAYGMVGESLWRRLLRMLFGPLHRRFIIDTPRPWPIDDYLKQYGCRPLVKQNLFCKLPIEYLYHPQFGIVLCGTVPPRELHPHMVLIKDAEAAKERLDEIAVWLHDNKVIYQQIIVATTKSDDVANINGETEFPETFGYLAGFAFCFAKASDAIHFKLRWVG